MTYELACEITTEKLSSGVHRSSVPAYAGKPGHEWWNVIDKLQIL